MQRAVSVYDLLTFERSREAILNDDYAEFYNILNELGFDIDRDIDIQKCFHRPLTTPNKVKEGARWVGTERTDQEWVESEYCTEENKLKLLGLKDYAFAKELEMMGSLPQFTQRAMDYLRTESPFHEYSIERALDEVQEHLR